MNACMSSNSNGRSVRRRRRSRARVVDAMNEDVDDDAFAPFSYRRARDVIDDTRGTVSGQNVPSTSSTSRRVALVVASAHRALIAHENGSVCVLDVTNLAKRRWIRGRGRVAALALDGVGARALVADARGEIVVHALRARGKQLQIVSLKRQMGKLTTYAH